MREIKFRAWDRDLKGWIVEWVNFAEGKAFILRGHMMVECNADVVQFTGLRDKNGKEIYEGDILKRYGGPIEGFVVYQAPSFVMKEKSKSKRWTEFHLAHTENQFQEILGNIYENPDLLK